jgi:hypothetical protein
MPWRKGESGNPSGKPAGHYSTDGRIKKVMPLILDNLVEKALEGDPVSGAAVINYQLHKESK